MVEICVSVQRKVYIWTMACLSFSIFRNIMHGVCLILLPKWDICTQIWIVTLPMHTTHKCWVIPVEIITLQTCLKMQFLKNSHEKLQNGTEVISEGTAPHLWADGKLFIPTLRALFISTMQIFDCAGVSSFQIWFHQAAKQVFWLHANQEKMSETCICTLASGQKLSENILKCRVLENGPLLLYLVLWGIFCIWKNSNLPPIRDSYYVWQMRQPECRHRLTSWLSWRQVGGSFWVFWKSKVFPDNRIGSPRR